MVEDGICPICKYPKKSGSSGRLTQWIVACNCDIRLGDEDPAQGVSIKICRDCGKRIGEGRAGSFTQFVFRFDICQCKEPKPISTVLDSAAQSIDEYYVEDQTEDELVTEAGTFPQERYKALSRLGSGTGGAVFLARDRLLNKLVAVKVLHWLEPKQIAAFQEEARVTNKVRHPSIVSLLDFGVTASGVPYMVLEHIAGVSLEELVMKNGPLRWQMGRHVFSQICDALEHAHNSGVLHRDIKPGNIIMESNDEDSFTVRLIDFGIAAMRNESTSADRANQSPQSTSSNNALMAGAPLFMSPDVGLGRVYDLRSETYSLGCSFYYALTGQPPYEGETAVQTIMLHANQPPPKLSEFLNAEGENFPLGLDELVVKALAKNPEDRFQSVNEFRQAMNAIVMPEVNVTIDVNQQEQQAEIKKKRQIDKRLAVVGVALLLIGVAIVVGITAFSRSPLKANAPAPDATQVAKAVLEIKADKAIVAIESQKWHLYSYGPDTIEIFGERKRNHKREKMYDYKYKGAEVVDEDFKELLDKNPITGVEISPMSKATGKGFRYLTNLPLEVVDIMAPNFDDEGAMEVSKIKTIKRLCISHTTKLTDKGLAYIADMPKVRTLQLRNIDNLPLHTFKILSRAKSLWQMDLGFSKPITLEDFRNVSKISTLHVLALSETEIGDEHIAAICKRGISGLEIDKTKITPKGLALLDTCPNLHDVKISPGNGISMARLKEFKKTHPGWKVKIVDPLDVIDVVKDFAF